MRDNSVSVEVDSERSLKEAWYNPFTWFDNNKDTKQEFDKTKLLPTKSIRKAGEQLRDRKKLMKQQLDSLRKEMGEGLDEGVWGSIPPMTKAILGGAASGYALNKYNQPDAPDAPDELEIMHYSDATDDKQAALDAKRSAEAKGNTSKKKPSYRKEKTKPSYKAKKKPSYKERQEARQEKKFTPIKPEYKMPIYGRNNLSKKRLIDFRKHNNEYSKGLWNDPTMDYSTKRNLEEWKLWGRRLMMTKLMDGEVLLKDTDFVPTPWEQAILNYGFKSSSSFNKGDWAPSVDEPIIEGVGIITAQNTTADVKPGETQRQAKKFGNIVDKDGRPPLLHKGSQSPELTTVKLTEIFKNLVK
jgi:hypothetical protein